MSIFKGERGGDFFSVECRFYTQKKLKPETFNDKKVYKEKCFSLS